jgi:hypothetical protein
MVQLKNAAATLRLALEEIANSTDRSKTAMLKVNLNEARAALARRVQEVQSKELTSPSAMAAVTEASRLLEEVDTLEL